MATVQAPRLGQVQTCQLLHQEQQYRFRACSGASDRLACPPGTVSHITVLSLLAPSGASFIALQRRREAYRRYCKLRDRGKLKNGSNPPLSAADNLSPAASSAVAHDAVAWAENGEASKAEAAEAVQQAALEQAAGQAEAAAAAGQKRPRGQRWGDAWTLCFRGSQEQRQQVRSVRQHRMMPQIWCYNANYGPAAHHPSAHCGSCSAAVLGQADTERRPRLAASASARRPRDRHPVASRPSAT